jgi:hypothetical protein
MSLASQLSFLESSTSTIQQINNNIVIAAGANASSTTTGALQIVNGGLAVGGSIFVGGIVTATTFVGAFAGTITGTATTATNVAAGTAGQLPYQSAPGTTAFIGPGTAGQILVSGGTGAPTYTNTGSIYVNRSTLADTATNAATAYATIGTLSTGTGFYGGSFNGSANQTWTLNTATLMATAVSAINLSAGSAMALPYQSASGTTAYLAAGTAGQILQTNSTGSAPTWVSVTGLTAGNATTATNIAAGTAGQLHYQSNPGITAFINTATTGNFLQANYVGAPTWTTTASMYVNSAVNAQNLYAGTTGQLVYQSGAGTTGFVGPGTAGQLLVSAGAGAPTYTNTSSIYVQDSNVSTNLRSGTAGQLHYQTGANASGFISTATTGNFLQSNYVGAPTWTTTASIYVNSAVSSEKLYAGTAMSIVYQSAANTTAFLAAGTGGYLLQTNGTGSAPSWVAASGLSAANATNLSGGNAWQIPYQSAPSTTLFANSGTTGQFWQATTNGAPTWTNTGSIYVNRATLADLATTATNAGTAYATIGTLTAGTGLTGSTFNGSANQTWTLNTSTLMATAVNIASGAAGSLIYQSGANATTSLAIGTNGYVLTSNGSAPVWTIASSVTSGNATNAANVATIAQTSNATYYPVFVSANNATSANMPLYTSSTFSINPATGQHNIGGSLYVAGDLFVDGQNFIVNTNTISSGDKALVLSTGSTSAALAVGAGLYIGATSSTAYTSLYYDGANGWIAGGSAGGTLMLGGATTPVSGAKLTVTGGANFTTIVTATTFVGALTGTATSANNLTGGAAGSLPYQTGAGATTMLGLGTSGYVLTAGASAPQWSAISGLASGSATTATNLAGGTAGQLHYQTGPGASSFVSTATTGNFLQANYVGAPTWTTTASMYVNSAVNAQNIYAGTAGQLVYQSAASTTAFVGPGTAGQILVSAGTSAPAYTNTSSIYVGRAVIADSASGGAGSVTNALTINNAGSGSASGITYNGSAAITISYNTIGAPLASQLANGAATGSSNNSISVLDSRSTLYSPGDRSAGLFLDFKANTTDSLADGGTYHGVITFRPYGQTNSDFSGGQAQQIGTTDNNNLWHRISTSSSTWGTWYKILDTNNIGTVTAGTSTQVQTVAQPGNATYYPTFVSANNASATAMSVYTTSSHSINPSNGYMMIGTGTPGAPLSFTDATGLKIQLNSNAANYYAIEKQAAVNSGDGMFKFTAGATSAGEFGFYNTTNLRLLINNSGFVGVNTAAPGARLDVVGDGSNNTFRVSSASGVYRFRIDQFMNTFWTNASAADVASVQTTGTAWFQSLGVGTTIVGATGEIRATNEVTAYYSDRRLKENVVVINNAVEKVKSLNGITYTPNDVAASFGYDKTVKLVGLFADEVEAVLPEATRPAPFDQGENGGSKSGENYKTIQYEKLVPLLVEAIKEQQKTIETLSSELENIKKQLGK